MSEDLDSIIDELMGIESKRVHAITFKCPYVDYGGNDEPNQTKLLTLETTSLQFPVIPSKGESVAIQLLDEKQTKHRISSAVSSRAHSLDEQQRYRLIIWLEETNLP